MMSPPFIWFGWMTPPPIDGPTTTSPPAVVICEHGFQNGKCSDIYCRHHWHQPVNGEQRKPRRAKR